MSELASTIPIVGRSKKFALLVVAIALGACSDSDPTPPSDAPSTYPRVRFTDCPFVVPGALEGLRCGELDTYENYAQTGPDARIIQVAFGIVPATDLPAEPDPIGVFVGGPGAGGLAEMALAAADDETDFLITDNRDLIMVDQRGAGFSTPFLSCDSALDPDDLDVIAAAACISDFEQQGVDLSQYRSNAIAQDFQVLREALEISQWNVYGESYGPIPGLLYAQRDPAGVRSVIFDSSTDNQVDIAVADVAARLDYITVLANQCAEETECAARFSDLRSTFIETFRVLMQDPLIVVADSETIEVDGLRLYTEMSDGDQGSAPAVLEFIVDLINQRAESSLSSNVSTNKSRQKATTTEELEQRVEADLMHAAVQCAAIDAVNFDSVVIPTMEQWPDDLLAIARESVSYPSICTSGLISIEQDLTQRDPVSLDVPALILGGALDSLVGLNQVEKLAESFMSPNLGIVRKGGHGVVVPPFNSCVDNITVSFLDNPNDTLDMACLLTEDETFVFSDD